MAQGKPANDERERDLDHVIGAFEGRDTGYAALALPHLDRGLAHAEAGQIGRQNGLRLGVIGGILPGEKGGQGGAGAAELPLECFKEALRGIYREITGHDAVER